MIYLLIIAYIMPFPLAWFVLVAMYGGKRYRWERLMHPSHRRFVPAAYMVFVLWIGLYITEGAGFLNALLLFLFASVVGGIAAYIFKEKTLRLMWVFPTYTASIFLLNAIL